MKFVAFTTVAASAEDATNAADLLDNLRQQTILAEELGFEAMWLGEHHFGPYGVGDVPNPTWARPSRTAPKATDLTSPPWGGGGNQAAVAQPLAAPKSAPCGADTLKSGILACENGPRAAHSHDASIPIHCLSDRRPLRSDSDRSDLVRAAALQDGRFAGRAWQRQGQDDRQPRNRGENRRGDT